MQEPSFLVIHGPNLDLLGTREPEIYGTLTLAQINESLTKLARDLGVQVNARQSNSEGAIAGWIGHAKQDEGFSGIVLNGAGYTHTSITIHDAIRASGLPCVEVHLSNIHARETFRHRSVTAGACIGLVAGLGLNSYLLGLRAVIDYHRSSSATTIA